MSSPSRVFLAAAWILLALTCAGLQIPLAAQYALLGLLVATGLPHGALDAALILDRFPRRALRMLVAYALAVLLVTLVWWRWPGASLAAFLALTWFHFGTADRLSTGRRATAWCEGLARGGVPLVITAAAHPAEVTRIFAVLVPETAAQPLAAALATAAPVVLTLAACAVVLALRTRQAATAMELPTLVLLFGLLPPLVAFSLYFSLLHAPRSAAQTLASLGGSPIARRAATLALQATIPVLLVAGSVSIMLMRDAATAPSAALLQIVFIGLAALTWPHVLLGLWRSAADRPA